jgi:hypothetical protein
VKTRADGAAIVNAALQNLEAIHVQQHSRVKREIRI